MRNFLLKRHLNAWYVKFFIRKRAALRVKKLAFQAWRRRTQLVAYQRRSTERQDAKIMRTSFSAWRDSCRFSRVARRKSLHALSIYFSRWRLEFSTRCIPREMDFARLVAAHQERRLRFVFDAWTQRTLSLTVSALQATSRWRKSILISAMRSWRKARRGILYRSRMAAERRETELVRKFFRYWKRCRVIRRKKAGGWQMNLPRPRPPKCFVFALKSGCAPPIAP